MLNFLQSRLDHERLELLGYSVDIMEDPMADFVRIKLPPAVGKSYATARLPSLYPNRKFIFIIPSHTLARTVMDHLDEFGTEYVHVIGKAKRLENEFKEVIREKPCWRTSGEEYFPGCSTCPYNIYKECDWHKQFEAADHAQVVITTHHQVSRCGEGRVVIYDESPETMVMNTFTLPTYFFPSISLGSKFKEKAGARTYTFYDEVELDEDFEVESVESYELKMFFMHNKNIKCSINGKDFVLFGETKTFLPDNFDKLIFTCATTDNAVASRLFNVPTIEGLPPDLFWTTYDPKTFDTNKIKNFILKFKGGRSNKSKSGWSKQYSQKLLNYVFTIISHWFQTSDVLVITKKAFEPEIRGYLPQASVVHYGDGRGINDYNRKFDLILIYGRFELTPLDFIRMGILEFDEKIVKQMEISEMLQCLHRGRPITHPKTPVIAMTDSNLLETEEVVSLRALEDYHNHPDLDTGRSLNKMSIALGDSAKSKKTLRGKSYLLVRKFMDYIRFDDH